ncbi:MAG: signal peptidase I [Clostridia bacterium]|nr:signal peptidase I [Clostridia bacterium]
MEEKKVKKEKSSFTALVFDVVSILASAVIAVGVCFTFMFRTIQVSGSSMYPTLKDGEQLILQSVYPEPENGDIVVTAQPDKSPIIEDVLVKRIIATEGQTVSLEYNIGGWYDVCVDGVTLDEPYIYEKVVRTLDYTAPVTVPEGYVYVMGDNRNGSTDSRDDRVGMIREEYIMGKAIFRATPFGAIEE